MSTNDRRHYFNQLAGRWDSMPAPPDATAKVERFVQTAVRLSDRLILDVGCGTGILLGPLLAAKDADCLVFEVDVAEKMLQENRRKLSARNVCRICAEALRLPFPESTFDLVLCFGVLPHLGAAESAISRLFRYLRPGGSLAIGHLMGSSTLNAFHASLDGPVNQDRLPTANDLSATLQHLGALVVHAEEAPDWYMVQGVKLSA